MRRRLPRPKHFGRMMKFLRQYREEAATQQRGSAFTDKEWRDLSQAAARTMERHDGRIEVKLSGRWAPVLREDD